MNTDFDHVNLNEIDPNASNIPDGEYTFIIAAAQKRSFTNEKGTGEYLSLRTAITDSDSYNGKSFYNSLFMTNKQGEPDKNTLKQLALIQRATGISQGQGQTVTEWFTALPPQQPRFKASLATAPRYDKRVQKEVMQQEVKLFTVSPA